ncbi:MAG TPA: thioredoxin family protein [Candidatus Dependentiae bacterium]|nr:thioredoxin family protein [Candidatus Dependentiae bacterium]HRQ62449.1 thioredoxin family protein [Candidatus Dependentiae bacterium]
MKCYVKQLSLMIIASVCAQVIYADDYTVRGPGRFNNLLGEHELAVVLFYNQDTERMKDMFVNVSKDSRYDKTGVAFIHANVGRYKDLTDVAHTYSARVPSIMLFRDGQRVKAAMLTGDVSGSDLRSYIDQHFGDRIDAIRKEQEKAREEYEASRPRSSVSFGIGVGVGYPYYGYPYYGYPYWGGGYWGGGRYYRGGYYRGGRGYYRGHGHGGHRGGGRRP